ncbi:MAG: tetratricopeptide repeat protein [Planctomycetota bacterium]|jgi:tetratricopeptide (TPR) repeat protein
MKKTVPGWILILIGLLVAAPPASGEEPPLHSSALKLLSTDVPPSWKVLPKGTGSEETEQVREVLKTFQKQVEGLNHTIQGIDAAGELVDLLFIGFPNEESGGKLGPLVKAFFAKRFPKLYGSVYAVVLTENKKLAEYLHTKIGKRYALARIKQAEEMINGGRHDEAKRFLAKWVPKLPASADAFLRVGDLYLFYLRPPIAEEALKAFRKALEVHAKEPLDPVYLALAHQGVGRSLARMGEQKKALGPFQKGVEAVRETARRLAACILLEKARLHAAMGEEEPCFESLNEAFELEASLGFTISAMDAKEDPALEDLTRRGRIASLISRFLRTKPKLALIPDPKPALDLGKEPMALLPVIIEGSWNPAAKLEPTLEKGLQSRFRGLGVYGVDYTQWRGQTSSVRWTAREMADLVWKGIEDLGCFDLRLIGPPATRGRGAELAFLAAEEARAKGIAPFQPARILVVHLAMEKLPKKVRFTVTAAVVEENGKILLVTRFERRCSSAQKHQRLEMTRIAVEIQRRFAKVLK